MPEAVPAPQLLPPQQIVFLHGGQHVRRSRQVPLRDATHRNRRQGDLQFAGRTATANWTISRSTSVARPTLSMRLEGNGVQMGVGASALGEATRSRLHAAEYERLAREAREEAERYG